MSDIYGPITEHPEFDITDERRFTVTIKLHRADMPGFYNGSHPRCTRCGYPQLSPVHIKEPAREPTKYSLNDPNASWRLPK